MSIFSDDLIGRHLVLQKAKILKGKSLVMEIRKTGIRLMGRSPYELEKELPWSEISDVSLQKSETEFTITFGKKKSTKTFATDGRTSLLTDLFSVWKKDEMNQYSCEQITNNNNNNNSSENMIIDLIVRATSFQVCKSGIPSETTRFDQVKKISVMNSQSNVLIIHSKQFRKQLFFCDQRDNVIQNIRTNMNRYLGKNLTVDSTESYDLFSVMEDNLTQVVYEIEVSKFTSQSDSANNETRYKLALDKKTIYEIDLDSKKMLSTNRFRHINYIVRMETSDSQFIIQYNTHWVGYSSVERDVFISTLIELAERDHLILLVRSRPSIPGCKLGDFETFSAEIYDYVLKRISGAKKVKDRQVLDDMLEEFVENFSVNIQFPSISDKKATQFLGLMLPRYANVQSIPERELILILESYIRIMTLPDTFNNLTSFAKDFPKFLYQCMRMDHPFISYLASVVVRMCIDEMHTHKTDRKEHANKLLILGEEGLSSLFDVIRLRISHLNHYTLLFSSILSILESCCHSGRTSTDKQLLKLLVDRIINQMDELLSISYHSRSLGIVYNSSVLIRLALQQKISEKSLMMLQTNCLKSTKLLQQLYLCLSCRDKDRMIVSSDIIGFLVEDYDEANAVLRRIFPRILFQHLEKPKAYSDYLMKKLYSSEKISTPVHAVTQVLPKKNWFELFLTLGKDVVSPSVIWNDTTRAELKTCIASEIDDFLSYTSSRQNSSVVWNHEEFTVTYDSLACEPRIDGYYLRPFISNAIDHGWGQESRLVENPASFSEQLHHAIMFNEDLEMKKMCLKTSGQLYTFYKHEIGPYDYLGHICQLLRKCDDLSLILEILVFINQLLTKDQNVQSFIEFDGVRQMMDLVTMVHDHSGDQTEPVKNRISQMCLTVLLRMASLHPSVNDLGYVYVPRPRAKVLLCAEEVIPHIVQLMLAYEDSNVFQLTVGLLNLLITHNDQMIEQLYQTGLFYFLFLYDGGSADEIVNLLKQTHKKQAFSVSDVSTGIGSDLSPHIASILNGLLPKEMIYRLDTMSSLEFASVFTSDSVNTPYIIWSKDMRRHLKQCILHYVSYFKEELSTNRTANFRFELMEPVLYDQLKDEFVCHHYYIKNFVRTDTWPRTFAIEDVEQFATALASNMEQNLIENEQLPCDFMEHLSLCVRAELVLFSQTNHPIFTTHPGCKSLVEILKRLSNDPSPSNLTQQILLEYQCIKLIVQLVEISSQNVETFIEQDLPSEMCILLARSLSRLNIGEIASKEQRDVRGSGYFTSKKSAVEAAYQNRESTVFDYTPYPGWMQEGDDYLLEYLNNDERLLEIIHLCLDGLFHMSSTRIDTVQLISQSNTITDCLVQCIQFSDEIARDVKEQALRILSMLFTVSNMQDQSFHAGLHIYLLSTILDYTLSPTDYSGSVELAVKCLRRMAGWNQQDQNPYSPCQENALVQRSYKQIFPSPLMDALANNPASSFALLDIKAVKETPFVLWNMKTLDDLDLFVQQERSKLANGEFDASTILSFTYKTHDCELRANGIFVRLYNTVEGKVVPDSPTQFLQELCALLRYEWALVNQQSPIDIMSDHFARVTIVLEAIYHSLKNDEDVGKNMDSLMDILPCLVSMVRVDVQISKAMYYLIHLFYMIIHSVGDVAVSALAESGLIQVIRNILYSHLSIATENHRDVLVEVHDELLTLLHKIYTKDERGVSVETSIEAGLFIYLFGLFSDCFQVHALSRTKSAFLLSQLVRSNKGQTVLASYVPTMLSAVIQRNPVDSIQVFERLLDFPELVWNPEMRSILKQTIQKQIDDFSSQLKSDPESKWILDPSFSIVYDYPRSVGGMFITMHIRHPNYPVGDFSHLINALIENIASTANSEQKQDSVRSLLICLGGDYYNKANVPLLSDNIANIMQLLRDGTLRPYALPIVSKMSHDASIIAKFSEYPHFLDDLADCMGNMPDQIEEGLNIVIRSVLKNPKIQCQPDCSLVSMLIEIVAGSRDHGLFVKDTAARALKLLSTENSLIEKMQQAGIYETVVLPSSSISEEDVRRSTISPPIHPGGVLSYMNISMDKDEDVSNRVNELFERLMGNVVLISKLLALEKQLHIAKREKEASSLPETNSDEHQTDDVLEPLGHQVISSESRDSELVVSQSPILVEEKGKDSTDTTSNVDSVTPEIEQEVNTSINESNEQQSAPPVPPPIHDLLSTITPSSPPPPPPPMPSVPIVERVKSTGNTKMIRRSLGSDLMSDIKKGIQLKPSNHPTQKNEVEDPTERRKSMGHNLIEQLHLRRTQMDEADSGSDSGFDSD